MAGFQLMQENMWNFQGLLRKTAFKYNKRGVGLRRLHSTISLKHKLNVYTGFKTRLDVIGYLIFVSGVLHLQQFGNLYSFIQI